MSEDPYADVQAAYGSADWQVEDRAVQSLLDAYIAPEIRRRQMAGELGSSFRLDKAQVVFYPDDRPFVVRLNSEVKDHFDLWNEPADGVQSDEDDPDSAHVMLILHPAYRLFALDFIYNKPMVRRHTARAGEFLLIAEHAAAQGVLGAFVENAFSAAELLAKAQLLRLGRDPGFREKTNHKAIKTRFDQYARFGGVEPQFAAALNRLQRLRGAARYLEGDLELTPDEAQELLKTLRAMQEAAERRLPKVEE